MTIALLLVLAAAAIPLVDGAAWMLRHERAKRRVAKNFADSPVTSTHVYMGDSIPGWDDNDLIVPVNK